MKKQQAMSKSASSLLSYIEQSGLLSADMTPKHHLIWNACFNPNVANLSNVYSVQAFKPYYDDWHRNNVAVAPTFDMSDELECIYCILPKQKEAAQYQLACSIRHLKNEGLLLSIAENEAGGKRLNKWFQELGLEPNTLSKSKCKIVWAYKTSPPNEEKVLSWIENGSPRKIQTAFGEFLTKPGIYGWKKTDLGSKILLDTLPVALSGTGADFGCGYGLLSKAILTQSKEITKLYAIDADYDALECCKKNLSDFSVPIEYLWQDLTKAREEPLNLDWIIMNPPFHEGKETQANIGQLFIQRAAENLKAKGILYMVANAHLPYEKTLQAHFGQIEKLAEQDGFKVYKAVK